MEYEIAVIGPKSLCVGFKAAGVARAFETSDSFQARKALEEFSNDSNVGLIIIGESVASESLDLIAGVSQNNFLPAVTVLQDSVEAQGLSKQIIRGTIERATGISFLTQD